MLVLGSEEELDQVKSAAGDIALSFALFTDGALGGVQEAAAVAREFARCQPLVQKCWVTRRKGNLCDAGERILLHQCAITVDNAQGVAEEVFAR